MKKIRLMAIALLAGSLGLASCGKNEEKSGDNTPGEQEVEKKVTSVSISSKDDKTEIKVGEKLQLTATVEVEGSAAKTVSWKSSDTSVATVSAGGLVTAKKADTVTITATSTEDTSKSATFTLTINEADSVVSVTIVGAPSENKLKAGASVFLSASVETTGDASTDVVWETSNPDVATVSESGKVTAVDEGTVTITAKAKDDLSVKDELTLEVWCDPSIVSVTVSGEPQDGQIIIGTTVQMTATVTKKGAAATGVTWSSSDNTVATIDANGVITPVAEGTFTVTATSVVDGTKSATSQIMTVVDHGFFPELYEYGYAFRKTYPEDEINAFAGVSLPVLTASQGFYFNQFEANPTEKTTAYASVILYGDQANYSAIFDVFDSNGFKYFYSMTTETNCYIDPSQKVQVMVGVYALDEAQSKIFISVDFYHTEDVWETSENTTDTEWEEETADVLEDMGLEIPFVTLGKEYDVYVYDDGTVEISDYCCDFTKLNGYETTLELAGFEEKEITEVEDGEEYSYTVYVKSLDDYRDEYISFGFTEYGNTIDAWYEVKEVEFWPIDAVAAFVENPIGSTYSVPAFEGSELVRYTFDKVSLDLGSGQPVDAAWIDVLNASATELEGYVGALISEGYVLDEENSYAQAYGQDVAFLQKGKICIVAIINYLEREATQADIQELMNIDPTTLNEAQLNEYYGKVIEYMFTGTFTVYDYTKITSAAIAIYADDSAMEVPGLYIEESNLTVGLGKTSELTVIHYEIDEQAKVTFSSSDDSIATVSETGVVTGVSEGEAVITATTTISEVTYSDTVTVKVGKNMETAVDALNAWLASEEVDTEVAGLPEIPSALAYAYEYDEEYDCFSIAALVTDEYSDYYFADDCELMGYTVEEREDYDYWIELDGVELNFYLISNQTTGAMYLCIDAYIVEPEIASTTFDIAEIGEISGSQDGFSYVAAKAGGQNDPIINSNHELRLVVNSTITISSSGDPITSIFISANNCGETKADGSLSCNVGTVTEVDGGFLWEGNATSVTFTAVNGKQVHIEYIEINGGGQGGGSETFTEFPMQQVLACLEGGTEETTFPVPEGTSFAFEEDEEYQNDCYVDVYGGDMNAYLAALEQAGFEVTDETEEYDCWSAVAPNGTLEIDLYDMGSYYYLDIYARKAALEYFPVDEIKAYLTQIGINTQDFPAAVGDEYYAGIDQYGDYSVEVVGGDCSAYLSALESAGFTIDDTYGAYGMYYCYKGDLEIDIIDYEEEGFICSFCEIWSLE